MTKTFILAALAGASVFAMAPAHAVAVPAGSSGLGFTVFDTQTRGTQQAFLQSSGFSSRISGTLTQAVYLNTLGTLDFYFQVARTTTVDVSQIGGINVDRYTGFTVDSFTDGTGTATGFTTANNPPSAGQPAGSTTTIGRSIEGDVVNINFGSNRLDGTENSTVYILRTNATAFDFLGGATITDGQSFNLVAFEPTTPAVPEPATWGLMLLGFGMVGAAARRSRRTTVLA